MSVASSASFRCGRTSPFRYALTNRIVHGSTPTASAMRSICTSTANEAIVTPKPRIALVGVRFVYTQYASIATFGIRYGPAALAACFVSAYGVWRLYAPQSA